MRQFIIKKKLEAPVENGNTIRLKISSGVFPDMRLREGVNTITLPFRVELMNESDRNLISYQYKLPKELSELGVMLLGAYEENDQITIGLMNMSAQPNLRFKEKQDILIIEVLEKVSLKPVKEFMPEMPKNDKKTTKRKKSV